MIRHVYRIESPLDPRVYIGVSAKPKTRLRQHKRLGYGPLWNAMHVLGADTFSVTIVSSHENRLEAYAAERKEAMRLLISGATLYNQTFRSDPKVKNKAPPIAVRPRQGTALEAVWEAENRSNRAMGEIIHSWAETFAEMVRQSDREEEQ